MASGNCLAREIHKLHRYVISVHTITAISTFGKENYLILVFGHFMILYALLVICLFKIVIVTFDN